jgi:hypothetical protein
LVAAVSVFLGRITGLVREIVLAHVLGLGRAADLALFALTLPDSITNLLRGGAIMGGAFGAVLIPEFKALQERRPSNARKLFVDATLLATLVFGAPVRPAGAPPQPTPDAPSNRRRRVRGRAEIGRTPNLSRRAGSFLRLHSPPQV